MLCVVIFAAMAVFSSAPKRFGALLNPLTNMNSSYLNSFHLWFHTHCLVLIDFICTTGCRMAEGEKFVTSHDTLTSPTAADDERQKLLNKLPASIWLWADNILSFFSIEGQSNRTRAIWTILLYQICSLSTKKKSRTQWDQTRSGTTNLHLLCTA